MAGQITRKTIPFIIILAIMSAETRGQTLPYRNQALPVDQRVADLLRRMTPQEKFWQLYMIPGDLDHATPDQYKDGLFGFQVSAVGSGQDNAAQQILQYKFLGEDARSLAEKINSIQKYFVEQTRLGIPLIFFDEALHGLLRESATVFPQAIGLAASFDTSLMHRVAGAIADETKQRGIRQVLSPVVNLAVDVRWGRTEETYGEDPFLTSRMGVAFVSAFEKRNIITTPKHFIANVGAGGRDSYPIDVNRGFLEETYLIPFVASIKEGGSRSVMTAYNSLDGEACTANQWLLTDLLKNDLGFKGFVISDAGATGGTVVLHKTATSYPESAQHAIASGLDVIFQTEYSHYKLFDPPFYNGKIDQRRIDDAVARVLRAKFELGLFEHPYVSKEIYQKTYDHRDLARSAARASIVLLKNDNNTLPISKSIRKLAVIGTDATEARLGGYSGPGIHKVSILEGLKQKLGADGQLLYAPGPGRRDDMWEVIPKDLLSHYVGHSLKPGLQFFVFDNIRLNGKPVYTATDNEINELWTLSKPDQNLKTDFYSVRWEGNLKSDTDGLVKIGLNGNDGYRLYIDDSIVINNWKKESFHTILVPYYFKKGKIYKIKVEYYEPVGSGKIQLIWEKTDDRDAKIRQAKKIAQAADAIVVVAGIEEGEFRDRAFLKLPGKQEDLIHQIATLGKPMVVLLIGGSAVTMNNWIDKADAVLTAWYPGEEGGHAVADVLFGDYSPAGRLPVTFPIFEGQLPLIYNHMPTGRGDDYLNLTGRPLFPFGFGLSYTTFDYSDIRLYDNDISGTQETRVSFLLKNTGAVAGEEVPQLYIRKESSSVVQPVMALKGFQRIKLEPGQSRRIVFTVKPELLELYNKENKWTVEPGDYILMIGASSADIKLNTVLTVK